MGVQWILPWGGIETRIMRREAERKFFEGGGERGKQKLLPRHQVTDWVFTFQIQSCPSSRFSFLGRSSRAGCLSFSTLGSRKHKRNQSPGEKPSLALDCLPSSPWGHSTLSPLSSRCRGEDIPLSSSTPQHCRQPSPTSGCCSLPSILISFAA